MDLLSLEDAALRLGRSRRFVERLIAGGELESVKIGRTRLVSIAALAAYVERHTVKAAR